jgi:2,4'-dihydroxyacetophenone dioxygenase
MRQSRWTCQRLDGERTTLIAYRTFADHSRRSAFSEVTMSAVLKPVPAALHRGERELPFVAYQEGVQFQLLQADIEGGLWVVRVKAQPGVTIQKHKHTGEVFAFTLAGSWRYLEYPEINTAGSYLYEPAGSVHTLHMPKTNTGITDIWFAIRGANLNLDDKGNVEAVIDAAAVLEIYLTGCRAAGVTNPPVIGA